MLRGAVGRELGVVVHGVCATLCALSLVACGSGSPRTAAAAGTYAGSLEAGGAFVAVVAGKSNVVVYVCDGKHGIGELFTGRRTGSTITLHDARGARVAVTLGSRNATGTFTAAGAPHSVHFAAVPAHEHAGLYRAAGRIRGVPTSVGWVVLGDGRQNGALTSGGRTIAAPTLSLATATATLSSGATISATRISPGSVSSTNFSGGFGGGFGG